MGEKVCAALIPCAVVLEILIYGFASCFDDRRSSPVKPGHTFDDVTRLARNSPFSVNEVEALRELFNRLSNSIITDGLIHKVVIEFT